MKIILSPSKTQNSDIRIESLNNPKYFKLTKMIIKELKSYSDDDISKIMKIKGKLLDLSTPKVMGILNITPDSFSDGGQFNNEKNSLLQV